MRKKGLANVCLYEILEFSPSRMRLKPSLDKRWHPNKKVQEMTQQCEDSMVLIAKVREPVLAVMLERIPLDLPEFPCYICWPCVDTSPALNVCA